jgi:transposase
MIQLSSDELLELKRLHKTVKTKREADRIKIILLLDKGFSQIEVSEILLLDEDTIRKWKNCFLSRQDNSTWFFDNYVPYWGKLSSQQISHTRQYCSIFRVRNCQEISDYIQSSLSVNYDLSSVQKLVHRIGLSYQQIHRLPGKVDLVKQEKFIEKYEQKIEQLADNEAVIFIDAVHPQHNTTPCKIWSKVGQPRWIESNTGRERLNINGAYNPISADVIVREDKTITGQSTIELLKQVSTFYQGTKSILYVFADNGKANKSRAVKEWLDQQSFIKMIYLPPYSPNLNLIERLWKFMRKKVISTKYYPELKDFKKAFKDFFDNIDQYKQEIKSFIGMKFKTFSEI